MVGQNLCPSELKLLIWKKANNILVANSHMVLSCIFLAGQTTHLEGFPDVTSNDIIILRIKNENEGLFTCWIYIIMMQASECKEVSTIIQGVPIGE